MTTKSMEGCDKQRFSDPQAVARREFVRQSCQWHQAYDRLVAEGVPMAEMASRLPSFDNGLFANLTCGARSKQTGSPCRMRVLCQNGRCRYHGGLSTGPRTAAGIAKVSRNLPARSAMK